MAATTALSTLLPLVTPYVPGCPQAMQLHSLRRGAVAFCRDSEYWTEDLEAIDSVDGDDEYALTVPTAYGASVTISRVVQVCVDDSLPWDESLWKYNPDGRLLVFANAFTSDDLEIIPTVVFVPTPLCTAIPGWIVTDWMQALAAWARYDLKSQVDAPNDPVTWADPPGAAKAFTEYQKELGRAKALRQASRRSGNMQMDLSCVY